MRVSAPFRIERIYRARNYPWALWAMGGVQRVYQGRLSTTMDVLDCYLRMARIGKWKPKFFEDVRKEQP